jgi:hypothetical protein
MYAKGNQVPGFKPVNEFKPIKWVVLLQALH